MYTYSKVWSRGTSVVASFTTSLCNVILLNGMDQVAKIYVAINAVLAKTSLMRCPFYNLGENKLVFTVPYATWHHLKSDNLNKVQTEESACISVLAINIDWGMKMTSTTNLVEFTYQGHFVWVSVNAQVVVIVEVRVMCGASDNSSLFSAATHDLGAVSIRKTVLPGMAIPMLKIRRPNGRLIFNMGIAIPSKTVFLIETAPSLWHRLPAAAYWTYQNNFKNLYCTTWQPYLLCITQVVAGVFFLTAP